MGIVEFLRLAPADQVTALDELTKTAGRVAALEEALKASRGREHWLELGGSAVDWDSGLSGVVSQFMQFDAELNASLDLEAHPALRRHLGQPQEEAGAMATTNLTRAEDWRQATAAREAKFPRVSA